MNMSLVSPTSKNPLANLPRFASRLTLAKEKKETPKKVKVAKAQQKQPNPKIVHTGEVKKKLPATEHSGTERGLMGNTLPGFEVHGTVAEILKQGSTRSVKFADGTVRRIPKAKLVAKFNEFLRGKGMADAMKTIHEDTKTGKVTAKFGNGKEPGVERTYDSVNRAQAAIRKAFKAK